MSFYYQVILHVRPLVLLDVWVQVIVPSRETKIIAIKLGKSLPFSALFSDPSWERERNLAPILGAIFSHFLPQYFILFLSPGALDHGGVQDFLPSVEALDIGPAFEKGGDSFPVFGLKDKLIIYSNNE